MLGSKKGKTVLSGTSAIPLRMTEPGVKGFGVSVERYMVYLCPK